MLSITNQEIRNLSSAEINNKINETRKKIFELKFKQATRQTIKPHLFKKYKRILARLLTINNEIQ